MPPALTGVSPAQTWREVLAPRRVRHQLEELVAADVHQGHVIARPEIDLGRADQSFIENCVSFHPRLSLS
jgi:hypothetical protein